MEQMLAEALDAGFVGMSSMQLLFDKIDGETCRSRTLPSTYAKTPRAAPAEVAAAAGADGCCSPGPTSRTRSTSASQVAQSLGIVRNPLKTSLLSAADVKSNPYAIQMMGPLARLVNRFGANFRWQHLPVPFEVYADGIDLVVFEEFGAGAAALHLRDEVERNELMRDEAYRRQFRKDYESKLGVAGVAARLLRRRHRRLPRRSRWSASRSARSPTSAVLHPVDAFLDLVVEHGTALRWRTTIANHRPDVLKKLAREPGMQMGFSDSGAHLRNMAFYNLGLRLLRHVQGRAAGGHAVHDGRSRRCTG